MEGPQVRRLSKTLTLTLTVARVVDTLLGQTLQLNSPPRSGSPPTYHVQTLQHESGVRTARKA
jgi:hypothetical protein